MAAGGKQELDGARDGIVTADETVALTITREWESQLLRLLGTGADAAAELSWILAEPSRSSVAQRRGAVRQTAKASGRSTVIQVGGDAAIGELPLIFDLPRVRL